MNNENKFKQAMLLLATTYNVKLSTERAEAYWEMIGAEKIGFILDAAKDHIRDLEKGDYFPAPSALLRRINTLVEDQKRRAYFIEQETKLIEKKPKTTEQIEIGMAAIKKMKESL